jgi:hypothetical protein
MSHPCVTVLSQILYLAVVLAVAFVVTVGKCAKRRKARGASKVLQKAMPLVVSLSQVGHLDWSSIKACTY